MYARERTKIKLQNCYNQRYILISELEKRQLIKLAEKQPVSPLRWKTLEVYHVLCVRFCCFHKTISDQNHFYLNSANKENLN